MRLFLSLLFFLLPLSAHAGQTPERSLFISVIEHQQVLASRSRMDALVSFAEKARIRTLFVQVYRANMAWFPSKLADSSPYEAYRKEVGEDPLGLLIRKAHARGMEVHAWVNLLSLSKNIKAPILQKYGPSILTRNTDPKKTIEDHMIDGQYFLEPGDPRVRRELGAIVEEIVTAYPDLDGIQFDYIRYPDSRPFYGHTPINLARFRKATGATTVSENSPSWKDWKRAQVTATLKFLIGRVRSVNKKIRISTTGCMSYVRAREEAFQDWSVWIRDGLAEFVTVMSYPDNIVEFEENIADVQRRVPNLQKVIFAVGAYKFTKTPEVFIRQFERCEDIQARGCAVFFYGSLLEETEMRHYLNAEHQ